MTRLGRTLDRPFIAKVSDARERLHDLLQRGRDERAGEPSHAHSWPQDLNAPDARTEVRRG